MSYLSVRKSLKFNGKGVFAKKDFEKGEIVHISTLKNISERKFFSTKQEQRKHIMIWNHKPFLLDKITKYINHSCMPNTKSIQTNSDKFGIDVAAKKIYKGEEITANYLPKVLNGMICRCGSKKCKKTILDKTKITQL